MRKANFLSILVVTLLLFSLFSNGIIIIGPLVKIVGAVDITTYQDTNTTINVTVFSNLPIINWYDFQNSTNTSKMNDKIDVEEQYKFRINVTSDQNWSDIDYVNITSWFDNGSEANTYNSTLGGNLNMKLQYENTTGNANWTLIWPDDEVGFNDADCVESVIDENTHNLTFVFTPRNQTRYAPAPLGWNTSTGHNDNWSWNFNITVDDDDNYSAWVENEYGVYMYSHITQTTESPSGTGVPGENNIELAPHTNVTTKCNANFTLSTDVANLSDGLGNFIQNTSLSAAGGDLSKTNFSGIGPLYIYGNTTAYKNHLINDYANTAEITYYVNISWGTISGNYSSTVTYSLNGET